MFQRDVVRVSVRASRKTWYISSFAISNSSYSPQSPKFVLNLQIRILNPFSNFLKAVAVTTKQSISLYSLGKEIEPYTDKEFLKNP